MGNSSLLRFVTQMNGSLFIMGDSSLLRFVTPMDGVSSLWEIVLH